MQQTKLYDFKFYLFEREEFQFQVFQFFKTCKYCLSEIILKNITVLIKKLQRN